MNSPVLDVIIIGAGAAGLMCAVQAGQRGRKVLVLEKSNKPGKKILMSGGGKCNFTNLTIETEHYLCHNPHFVISALSRYSHWDFIGMVCDHHIAYEERDLGKLFTLEGSKHILDMLLNECAATQQVDIRCQAELKQVQKIEDCFVLDTSIGTLRCQSLVIASGGLSIPTLGGSGIGYQIAKQFGHHVYPTRAGLVPFTFSDQFRESTAKLSGNALPVILTHPQASFQEPLLFTHRGLSGPSSLQLSNYWDVGQSFQINFLPQRDAVDFLLSKKIQQPKVLLRTLLSEFFAKSIVLELQHLIWSPYRDVAIGQLSDQTLQDIAHKLQNFTVKPSGTEGYRTAEVTLGGVDTHEISSKTMQSQKQQGLYFIGEVLDVTGHLGGYNFQWAWSSGFAAGSHV